MDDQRRALHALLKKQHDVVARWQLRKAGWKPDRITQHVERHGWQTQHSGVYVAARANPTDLQRAIAATLTTPHTNLSHNSSGAFLGFRYHGSKTAIVTRPGDAGPIERDGLLILHSTKLAGNTVVTRGVRHTSAARTLLDLAPVLDDRALKKAVREAIRLKRVGTNQLHAVLATHRGRAGSHRLAAITADYAPLPIGRTKSDAEALALAVLATADRPAPRVNIDVAGEEADLVWPAARLIIEIDGPQYHLFEIEDARKQAIWEAAGWTVLRIPSGEVFEAPWKLLALAPPRRLTT